MSRPEGKIDQCGTEPVDAAEILASLSRARGERPDDRRDAVSRYLSAVDGWREASARLGGAFASKDEDPGSEGKE